jgi:7,8-dihydro-6-hydroxymethylpterin-pyrophosphokinase
VFVRRKGSVAVFCTRALDLDPLTPIRTTTCTRVGVPHPHAARRSLSLLLFAASAHSHVNLPPCPLISFCLSHILARMQRWMPSS